LFFKNFYAIEEPVILCEGKTDSIYLKSALRKLAKLNPLLVEEKDGKIRLKVRFFPYSEISKRILGLGGGSPHVKQFLLKYQERCKKYKFPSLQHPVIIVLDNDDGAKPIFSATKLIKNEAISFYSLAPNIRIVTTPLPAGKTESMIEDFFQSSVTAQKLGTKVFSWKNEFDEKTEYGKHYFAEYIVKKNQDSIDFSGFQPLLNKIAEAIASYKP
jgi:RNA-directed DNA polymerase